MVLEVQGLLISSEVPNPRRSATGFDQKRMGMLLAVMQKQLQLNFSSLDAYVSVVGGLKINEPGADVAVCAALTSSMRNATVPADMIAIGEVGLAGELRSAGGTERRLAEAARLGFKRAVIPISDCDLNVDPSLQLIGASTLFEALSHLGVRRSTSSLAAV